MGPKPTLSLRISALLGNGGLSCKGCKMQCLQLIVTKNYHASTMLQELNNNLRVIIKKIELDIYKKV